MTRLLLSMVMSLVLAMPVSGAAGPEGVSTDEFVVVIDPGHGGKDYGAIGSVTNEKTINLKVAREVRDILGDDAPEIKVIMTRSDDKFVSLSGRANIANKAGGDLFVSIHTNSVDKKNPNRKKVAGASVYSLGLGRTEENLAVAMRENSVMTLEPDYTTTYEGFDPNSAESYIIFEMDRDLHMEQSISAAQHVQNRLIGSASRQDRGVRQAGFLVLRATSMPAILVELDFICNPRQERYMASADGQKELGSAIAEGIMSYRDEAVRARAHIDGKKPAEKPKATKPAKPSKSKAVAQGITEIDEPDDAVYYRIQFLTLPRTLRSDDKRLGGLPGPVNYYRHSGSVKYTSGRYATEAEALEELKKVKRKYADAFVICTKGNARL